MMINSRVLFFKVMYLLILFMPTLLFSSIYSDGYSLESNETVQNEKVTDFNSGSFDEIIRFNMIEMREDEDLIEEETKEILNKIHQLEDNNASIRVTILGHTDRATDDANEIVVESDTFVNYILNFFRCFISSDDTQKIAQEYAEDFQNRLVKSGVDKNITYVESRGGIDESYTPLDTDSREASNGVRVAIYVISKKDIDSDGDGVFDKSDKCVDSPRGFGVDSFGCTLDSDWDGVLDDKDECPKTPTITSVDLKGCPLDEDNDGVADYKDQCLDTLVGLAVNPYGCPINHTLKLNFKTSSAKILSDSYSQIKVFSEFMKNNPAFKAEIIGHTDSVGKAEENMKLSEDRALNVKKALIQNGVEEWRLVSRGRGELDPLESNRTESGRLTNRRTEIVLFY
ncbi:OmpA family protein [Sulfurimonas aquatica]|uniref:OmpA family protein n=1 Tax=Sulfurimonas aquatica TaxID=2672570 RepID=A0A975GBX2_9BACT|nr:OmpA family protein [Sulfurimonas aquatica]QSZ41136.1 OmpA family protein [Sulfurimonas aquatica]